MRYKTWQERIEEVVKYKKEHNKLPTENYSQHKHLITLAQWLRKQRRFKKLGELSKNKINLLESIGIVWDGKKQREDNWDENFKRLKQFKNKNPNSWPSWYSKDRNERSLAIWCHFNRTWYRGTRRGLSKYPKERRQNLDSIGFIWNPGDWDRRWLERYKELKKYRKENPHRWPPIKMKKLYTWMRSQREIYRTGILSKERIDLLNRIGFDCNPRNK